MDIPFRPQFSGTEAKQASEPPQVLLVNALDPRKNIDGIGKALTSTANRQDMVLAVVGRERMPLSQALDNLKAISDLGIAVKWYRHASDEVLQWLYGGADVLLFPSYYEGLGLPILEAQARGLPVVSSDTSSCVEVNLNPTLCAPPGDSSAIADMLCLALKKGEHVLRGGDLRAAQATFLASRSAGARALVLDRNSIAT